MASCAISTGPRPSLAAPAAAPDISCGGPLLLTRWRAVARCADGSSALQALLSVGRVQPGHSQFTRLLRAEYFLWRRRMQTGCTRLAVKQWPGIGVTMECARDAPLPRPSTVMPCAYDFTRSCFLGSFALLTSPQPLCQCDAGRTLVLRPGLGVTMELETLLFGGLRGFAVRMCYKVLRLSLIHI